MSAWYFFVSLLVLIGVSGWGLYRDKQNKRKKRGNARNQFRFFFAAGVLISAMILLIPIQKEKLTGANVYWLQVPVASFVYAMQLFTLNVEYKELPWTEELFRTSGWIGVACAVLLTLEFVLAPMLSFTIVLSLFRNVYAWFRRNVLFRQNTYVFSELNERSLVLAESIQQRDKHACLIFTDVNADKEEELPEYRINRARKMKAVFYKQDILSVSLSRRSQKKDLTLYLIGEEKESKNIVQAMELLERFRDRPNCKIYIFTDRSEGEYLLNKRKDPKTRKVIRGGLAEATRINAISSLIFRNLYDKGYELIYKHAVNKDGIRTISAVLVGLGRHGVEMLKALTWYCQMNGYMIRITAFEKDPEVYERIRRECPELEISAEDSHQYGDPKDWNDAAWQIRICAGVDAQSERFRKLLSKIEDPTYVLVALGDDEHNIRTAVDIRVLLEREKKHPYIQAIVYNSRECEILKTISNYKGDDFGIEFIGDVESSFTEEVLINSSLKTDAETLHTEHYDRQELYDYEYNYRSSCASAIHLRAVISELRQTALNWELLPKVDFQLKLAFHLGNKDLKIDQNDPVIKALLAWAKDMRMLADLLLDRLQKNWKGWSTDSLQENVQEKEDPGRWFSVQEKYKAIVWKINDLHMTNEMDCGMGPDYTLGKIREAKISVKDKDEENAREVLYHISLVMGMAAQEHRRWNAYMRTEGFVHGDMNPMARQHQDLVRFEKLPSDEKKKDLHIGFLKEKSIGQGT